MAFWRGFVGTAVLGAGGLLLVPLTDTVVVENLTPTQKNVYTARFPEAPWHRWTNTQNVYTGPFTTPPPYLTITNKCEAQFRRHAYHGLIRAADTMDDEARNCTTPGKLVMTARVTRTHGQSLFARWIEAPQKKDVYMCRENEFNHMLDHFNGIHYMEARKDIGGTDRFEHYLLMSRVV